MSFHATVGGLFPIAELFLSCWTAAVVVVMGLFFIYLFLLLFSFCISCMGPFIL
jgi:hypothetical protein